MTRKQKKYLIVAGVLVILAASAIAAHHKKSSSNIYQTNQQNSTTASSACDASLWQHVYHPQRLHLITQCVTVTGIIDAHKHEADGDVHIRLKLDPQYSSMLNAKNMSDQGGDLVIEPVCEEQPTQTDAFSACQNYRSNVVVPPIGTHVQVVGAYVNDADHGWNEIHPVTSITAN